MKSVVLKGYWLLYSFQVLKVQKIGSECGKTAVLSKYEELFIHEAHLKDNFHFLNILT